MAAIATLAASTSGAVVRQAFFHQVVNEVSREKSSSRDSVAVMASDCNLRQTQPSLSRIHQRWINCVDRADLPVLPMPFH
ncbi:MAG: hypothetical protein WAO83_05370 [Fuerstiella sp.]